MTRATTISLTPLLLRAFVAAASSLAALAALTVLWRERPAVPELPSSLSSPVTTALLQELVIVAAWLLSALVILLLLVRVLLALVAHTPRQPASIRLGAVPAPRHRSFAHAGLAAGSTQPAFAPPFPLIPRARPEPRRGFPQDEPLPERARPTPRNHLPPPRIALLGPVKIAASKPRRRGLRSHTQELLAYLALHAEGATTDELVAVLWPDIDDDNARKRVWRAVSEARSQLGNVIVRAGEQYVLDRNAVAVDLDEFDTLLALAGARRDVDREQLLERALALVRGQPLAGTDYPWAAGDVRHLCAKVGDLLQELGNLCLDSDNPTGALAAAEQAIALDAYNESAHRLAMRAESTLSLRQAIVERYERVCRELDTQFGLEPERETRLLYRRLLSQDARGAARATRAT